MFIFGNSATVLARTISMGSTLVIVLAGLRFMCSPGADGYLAGLDVSCTANIVPVPVKPRLVEPPFDVYGV
jgi:hypothetical protein